MFHLNMEQGHFMTEDTQVSFDLIAELKNAIQIIDHACDQGAFRGWAAVEQVLACRGRLVAFTELMQQAITPTEATAEAGDEPAPEAQPPYHHGVSEEYNIPPSIAPDDSVLSEQEAANAPPPELSVASTTLDTIQSSANKQIDDLQARIDENTRMIQELVGIQNSLRQEAFNEEVKNNFDSQN
jgi:hypothetical protein